MLWHEVHSTQWKNSKKAHSETPYMHLNIDTCNKVSGVKMSEVAAALEKRLFSWEEIYVCIWLWYNISIFLKCWGYILEELKFGVTFQRGNNCTGLWKRSWFPDSEWVRRQAWMEEKPMGILQRQLLWHGLDGKGRGWVAYVGWDRQWSPLWSKSDGVP